MKNKKVVSQIYAPTIATAVGYTLAITNSVRITNFLVSGVTGQENALVNIFFEEGSAAYNNAINIYNGIASFLNFVNAAYFTIGIATALTDHFRYLKEPKQNGTLVIGAGDNPKSGAYNTDINPVSEGVHLGDANSLPNVPSGSQSKIIIENPYGYEPLNPEITRVLAPNGEVEIIGNMSNRYFKEVYNNAGDYGYKIVSSTEIVNYGQYYTTSGKPVAGILFKLILELIGE